MPDNQIVSFPGNSGEISVPAGVLHLDFVEGRAELEKTGGGTTRYPLDRFGMHEQLGHNYAHDDEDGPAGELQIFGTFLLIKHTRALSVAVNHPGASRIDFGVSENPAYITASHIREIWIHLTATTTLRVECQWQIASQKGMSIPGTSPTGFAPGGAPGAVIWTAEAQRNEVREVDAFGANIALGAADNVSIAVARHDVQILSLTVVQKTGAVADYDVEIWQSALVAAGGTRAEPPVVADELDLIFRRNILTGLTNRMAYVERFDPPLEYLAEDDALFIYVRIINNAGGTASDFDIVMKLAPTVEV